MESYTESLERVANRIGDALLVLDPGGAYGFYAEVAGDKDRDHGDISLCESEVGSVATLTREDVERLIADLQAAVAEWPTPPDHVLAARAARDKRFDDVVREWKEGHTPGAC